jgi:RNase adaptor protein for sRNA GlmZ degradation
MLDGVRTVELITDDKISEGNKADRSKAKRMLTISFGCEGAVHRELVPSGSS